MVQELKSKIVDRDLQRNRLVQERERPIIETAPDRVTIDFGNYRVLIEQTIPKDEIVKKRKLVI